MPYIFSGLRPFMEQVCFSKGRDLHQLGRAVELWHSKQIQDALGQLPRLADRKDQIALLAHVSHVREGLACGLEGIDLAIREVVNELGLAVPYYLQEDEDKEPRKVPSIRKQA